MSAKPPAFLLTGAFRVICRNPRYLTELARRGLRILVICPDSSRAQAEAVIGTPGSRAALITDIAYVDGALDRESSFNPGVFAELQKWTEHYRIVGAYAMEETLVEPTGMVCDALGLPGPGLRASRVCRTKYLQRAHLAQFGPQALTVPPGRRHLVELEDFRYPVVVKPATRHASSGVLSCDNADEVAAVLSEYREHETALIEQKVIGQEFSVESLVRNGEVVFSSVTEKETTDTWDRTFVELAHSVPAAASSIGGVDVTACLSEANRRVLATLAFENGITHSEWRVTAGGEAYLMEIASRTPGDGLTILYELACGVPLEPQIVAIALGEEAAYPPPRRRTRQVYVEHGPGILRDVTLDWPGTTVTWIGETDLWPAVRPGEAGDAPALRSVLVLKGRGSRLEPLRSSDDRAVTFFIDADTDTELDALEARVRAAIRLDIDYAGKTAPARVNVSSTA
ncbi:MAG: ATP-grasp domain-containing protein [Actinophytocola sp.]|uniref:ATP-grasp domain-containing protein n=1 Tax=Actinophytocola sp. TaxID=1872138 RepID=UPI003D6B1B5B